MVVLLPRYTTLVSSTREPAGMTMVFCWSPLHKVFSVLEFKYPALLPPFPFVYTFITIWPWSLKVPASCFLLPITSTPDRFFFAADTGVFHRKRNASARNAIIAIHVIENVRAAAGLTLPAAPAAANLPVLPGYTCSSVFLIKRFISSPFSVFLSSKKGHRPSLRSAASRLMISAIRANRYLLYILFFLFTIFFAAFLLSMMAFFFFGA